MPQFLCIHCGQRVEADEDMTGIDTNCPTCSRSIVIPGNNSLPIRIDSTATRPAKQAAPPRRPTHSPVLLATKASGIGLGGVLIATLVKASWGIEQLHRHYQGSAKYWLNTSVWAVGMFAGLAGMALLAAMLGSAVIYPFKRQFVLWLSRIYSCIVIALGALTVAVFVSKSPPTTISEWRRALYLDSADGKQNSATSTKSEDSKRIGSPSKALRLAAEANSKTKIGAALIAAKLEEGALRIWDAEDESANRERGFDLAQGEGLSFADWMRFAESENVLFGSQSISQQSVDTNRREWLQFLDQLYLFKLDVDSGKKDRRSFPRLRLANTLKPSPSEAFNQAQGEAPP